MGRRKYSPIRQIASIALKILVIFLAVSTCSYATVNQPVLRLIYEALTDYWDFIVHISRLWGDSARYVLTAYRNSMFALGSGLALAYLFGVPAGLLVGLRSDSRRSTLIRMTSSLGTIVPSFLWALLIMIFFVQWILPLTGIRFIRLSSAVSEFDPRRLFPIALTLMVRPLAYIVTVTASATSNTIASDYIRTARGKGLSRNFVLIRHIWPNVLPDILNAIPSSFLFSMSSLLIVEFVFNFPGVGYQLLRSIVTAPDPTVSKAALVSFLLTSVGVTYVLVVFIIEFLQQLLYPFLQPPDEP